MSILNQSLDHSVLTLFFISHRLGHHGLYIDTFIISINKLFTKYEKLIYTDNKHYLKSLTLLYTYSVKTVLDHLEFL